MISYAPCISLARVTADEGGETCSNASSRATKGVNVQFFTFICKTADAITRSVKEKLDEFEAAATAKRNEVLDAPPPPAYMSLYVCMRVCAGA